MDGQRGESISFQVGTTALAAGLVTHLAPRWAAETEERSHGWAVVVSLDADGGEPAQLLEHVKSWSLGCALGTLPYLVAGQGYVIASALSLRKEGTA